MAEQRTNIDVKRSNRVSVYRQLLVQGRSSIQQLSRALEMSVPTVTKNINELIEKGLLEDSGEYDSTGGRRPRTVSPIIDAKIALGIDITQHHIGLVAVDLVSNVLKYKRPRKDYVNEDGYYAEVAGMLEDFIDESSLDRNRILGVGIAIPGIVTEDGQTITGSGVLEIVGEYRNPFAKHIPYPNDMINEASAAGFIEWFGSKDLHDLVYLSLSNSVGGAIIVDDQLYHGDTQKSAEFGHVIIHHKGKKCYCGKTGCYDSYGSALLLSDLAAGNLSVFFSGLRDGNSQYREVFDLYLDDLAFMIGNLRTQYDSTIVLGGYVGSYLEEHIPEIMERSLGYTQPNIKFANYIRACRYKIEASAVGAAMRYLYEYVNSI